MALDAAAQPHGAPISASASEVDTAKGLVDMVRAALIGASGEERLAILFPLADLPGMKPEVMVAGSEADQVRFWKAYHAALAHVPAQVLDGAVKAYIAQAPAKDKQGKPFPKKFPEPGVLLDLCRADHGWSEAMKLRRGLERIAAVRLRRVREAISAEEEAAIMAKCRASLDALALRLQAEGDVGVGHGEAIRERLRAQEGPKSLRKAAEA